MSDLPRAASHRFRVSAHWSALPTLLLIWAASTLVARRLLRLPTRTAALAGGAMTLGHLISEVWHQLGHIVAARLTGYPMSGLRFWGPFCASRYPRDEPPLPAGVHIRRALGGPLASGALAGILALLVAATPPSLARRILWVMSLENLLVFTLQVFIPVGFNDGATLREWLGRRGQADGR